MELEQWKMVPDYEGMYMVSNLGRVKSIRFGRERILKAGTSQSGKGYKQVCLCKNGVKKYIGVHILVAMAFIQNPQNLPEVNHKDEDKSNNCVDNLEWCDRAYNCAYGTARVRQRETMSKKPIKQLTLDKKMVSVWQSPAEVQRVLGYDRSHIRRCCIGQNKSAYGYLWEYVQN